VDSFPGMESRRVRSPALIRIIDSYSSHGQPCNQNDAAVTSIENSRLVYDESMNREQAWAEWQSHRARWPKQAANASGRYDAMFKALRSCDEVQIYPIEGETVKQLGCRVRAMLMVNIFTGIDRWEVRTGEKCVLVRRVGPR
jgi:hypothetical protein